MDIMVLPKKSATAFKLERTIFIASLGDGGEWRICKAYQKYEGLTKQKERGKKPLISEEVLLLESDALHADYLLGNQLDRLEKKLRTA